MSLPSQGAWIEIGIVEPKKDEEGSRSLHRERGLKCDGINGKAIGRSRSLHRERGLKS